MMRATELIAQVMIYSVQLLHSKFETRLKMGWDHPVNTNVDMYV